ncbi:TAT-variant-translocated molybdopterin oxidoreductase [Luteolibacter luteus]|uniref:TAT-variant-translocated molybdopterin oxidoreductase n=1 Tax=Luteolibacter luteus TaxID=2728835 RepID=A0A858RLD2_9BACT|nr:TAT-variant-translocated molybdopterin oxidoreductase [Luteolibacter luteus]QJE97411.1 TAT-variant-translocated molybdopterin oxidoreductase [Luteolibacter luteus]
MSKRIWQHPEVPAGETTVSWRGVGQLEDTPEFRSWMEREFPQGVAEMENEEDAEVSRRSFLKLMGASTALAGFGMAACRRPESYIVPYNKAPEWVIPGKATYYASSMPRSGGAAPLVVTTFEGRPTKVAPNMLHPDMTGTDAFVQASILDLYSPSRSRKVLNNAKASSRAEFEKVLAGLAADGSAKVGFVFGNDDSPTRSRLVKELAAKYSGAKFYAYEALEGNAAKVLGAGNKLAADYAVADRILSLDSDFLCLDGHGPTASFFNRRKPEGAGYDKKADPASMNRLYVVESTFSMTGGMADHRLRVAPSLVLKIAAQIARGLGVGQASNIEAVTDEKHLQWVNAVVADLQASGGKSLVLAGSRLPEAVQVLALAINEKLGNIGEGKPLKVVRTEAQGLGDFTALTADLNGGAIDTLFLLTPANPVFDAPADSKFPEALAKAKTVIHLGPRTDATAHASTWHVPATHYLESWSDARTINGVYTIVQPMILPLYNECASELEILAALLTADGKLVTGETSDGKPSPAYDAVRATFEIVGGKGIEPWKKLLRDGYHAGTSYEVVEATVPAAPVAAPAAASGVEVVFVTDGSVYDGRWIDNGWLQEAPDPVSKLSWDNAALIAPETAKNLGVYQDIVKLETERASRAPEGDDEGGKRTAPMIKVSVNGAELELPVMIAFGQAENTIVIPLGYGQGFDKEDKFNRNASGKTPADHVGQVGVNSGFNAYPLRTAATSYFASGATVVKTGKRYPVALVQEHFGMYGRALAREISTMTDEKKGNFDEQLHNVAKQGNDGHAPPNISLYKQENKKGQALLSDPLHQWGMTIDLSACMGCNACLVACQAENNIPIVGKEQLAKGREMHWIRMDRYYAIDSENTFDPGSPTLVPQPVACVQCESAPCETVCPVNATVHTEDGLNAMAYNRCIGTRYCANNCPYKARRFNFFDYNKRNPLVAHNLYKGPFGEKQVGTAPHLQRNPNVSVRMRGVMEKCTYCVQRLKDAKIRQKRGQKQEALLAGKPSADSEVTTNTLRIAVDSVKVACQEACPAGGIEFGNLLDGDKSVMVRAKGSERNYDLLNYIGTKPRTSYLARVKNPNPAMPDAKWVGKATIHMH